MPRIDTLSGSDALGTFVDLQQFPASTVVHEIPAHAIHTVHLTLVNESNALIAFTFREANNLTIATTFFVPRQGKLDLGPLALRGPASWLVSVDKNPDHARIGGLVDVVYSK